MIKIYFIFGLIILVSCKQVKKDSSKGLNSTNTDSQASTTKAEIVKDTLFSEAEIVKDTLFSDYYYKMPLVEIIKRGTKLSDYSYKTTFSTVTRPHAGYLFLNGNDSINFEINYRLNNEKLDTFVLFKRGDFNQKDFDFLLTLFREKYGKYKLSKRVLNVLYKSNYKIKHIYWNNEIKSNFNYSSDIHKNLSYIDGESKPNVCYTFEFHNNSSKIDSKPGYHIHAKDKESNEKWVFEVDVNRLNDEFVKYRLTNFEFRDSIKVIDIQKYELENIEYRNKPTKLTFLDLFVDASPVNAPKILPDDYIKIKYYMMINDKTHQKRKINIDSLKKERLRQNKNDI